MTPDTPGYYRAVIHRDGRTWWAHRTAGLMDVSPPLTAWTRDRLVRKVEAWIAKERKRDAERAATRESLTSE